jgi:hypothetical protein
MKISISRSRPWLFKLRIGKNEADFRTAFKRLPCWSVDPKTWNWYFPRYLAHELEILLGESLDSFRVEGGAPLMHSDVHSEGLYPHQRGAILKGFAKYVGRRFVFADDPGGGKSAEAIRFVSASQPNSLLVVCPASVRSSWEEQLHQWAPAYLAERAKRINVTRTRVKGLSKAQLEYRLKAYHSPVQIVSYNLLDQVNDEWDAIIFDEAHRLKSPNVKWTKRAMELSCRNPNAAVAVLSATINPNNPLDCFGPMTVAYPGIFGEVTKTADGRPHRFKARYSNAEQDKHGYWNYKGLNSAYLAEFRSMLDAHTARTTKPEFAKYLPPLSVITRPLEDDSDLGRVAAAADWLIDAGAEGKACVIFTHHRALAAKIAEKVKGTLIDGSIAPDKRNDILRSEPPVVVATMDSVGEGVNSLTYVSRALFVELQDNLLKIIQAIGRVNRLSSTEGAIVEILKGEDDSATMTRLSDKISQMNELSKLGLESSKLLEAIGQSEDEYLSDLGKLLNFDLGGN